MSRDASNWRRCTKYVLLQSCFCHVIIIFWGVVRLLLWQLNFNVMNYTTNSDHCQDIDEKLAVFVNTKSAFGRRGPPEKFHTILPVMLTTPIGKLWLVMPSHNDPQAHRPSGWSCTVTVKPTQRKHHNGASLSWLTARQHVWSYLQWRRNFTHKKWDVRPVLQKFTQS